MYPRFLKFLFQSQVPPVQPDFLRSNVDNLEKEMLAEDRFGSAPESNTELLLQPLGLSLLICKVGMVTAFSQ